MGRLKEWLDGGTVFNPIWPNRVRTAAPVSTEAEQLSYMHEVRDYVHEFMEKKLVI